MLFLPWLCLLPRGAAYLPESCWLDTTEGTLCVASGSYFSLGASERLGNNNTGIVTVSNFVTPENTAYSVIWDHIW